MNRVISFISDSFQEVQTKVSWPKYSELQDSTILVLVSTVIFALLVFGVDFGFKSAIDLFYDSFLK